MHLLHPLLPQRERSHKMKPLLYFHFREFSQSNYHHVSWMEYSDSGSICCLTDKLNLVRHYQLPNPSALSKSTGVNDCLETGKIFGIALLLYKLVKSHFQEKTEISQYKLHSDKSQNNVIVGPYDSP